MRLLEGPHLQTVDVEVLLGGEWLIVEGGAFGGGASVQLAVQPKTQMAASSSHLQRVGVAFHKVGVLPRPAVHLNFRAEAVKECLSSAIEMFTDSEGMS